MTDIASESPHAGEPIFARATQRVNAAIVCFDGFGSHVRCSALFRSINIMGFSYACRSLCLRGKLDTSKASIAAGKAAV